MYPRIRDLREDSDRNQTDYLLGRTDQTTPYPPRK